MEPLVEAILVISPWLLLSVLVVVPIVVPLLLISSSSTTVVASIVELITSSVVELVLIVVTMVVLVVKPAMILVMAVIPSLANLVVPLTHLLATLLHVVVVSRHFHVIVLPLVLPLHVVVPLLLLLHHLRALTELWRGLVEVVRMLQLVNRRRLVLNMVARWRLLHLSLVLLLRRPLLSLLWDLRMLGLVAALMVERHRTSVPHARVAQIMHGRVDVTHVSTSNALMLHRNRGLASMTMGLSNWRGRSRWRHRGS